MHSQYFAKPLDEGWRLGLDGPFNLNRLFLFMESCSG